MSTLFVNNINTASGTDITIPTGKKLVGTDGGGISAPGMPVQIVASQTTLGSTTMNSNSYVATGTAVSITPKLAGSKIYLDCRGAIMHHNAHSTVMNYGSMFSFYRDVNGGGYADVTGETRTFTGTFKNDADQNHWEDVVASMHYLDTPSYSLGQTVNYKIYGRRAQNNSGNGYWNHTGGISGANGANTPQMIIFTATEIAG